MSTRSKILRAKEAKGISGITKIHGMPEDIAQYLKRMYTKEILDIK